MLDEKISAVAELLSESWRLNQFTRNLAAHVTDEKLRKKISNQVARFDKKFLQATEVFGLQVVDFTGTEFETGLPVAPINLADFAADDELIVEAMLEPTIKLANSAEIVKRGGRFKSGGTAGVIRNVFASQKLSHCRNSTTKT